MKAESPASSEELAHDLDFPQLRVWKDTENVPQLAKTALDPNADYGARWFAARYLGEFSEPTGVAALAQLRGDPDMRLRQQAARSLRQIGPPGRAALPALVEALFDGEGVVRVAAARALGAIGDDSPIPHLVKAAQTTGWDTLHSWVTSTLVELRAAEAAPHLLKRLQAPRSWQGRWAARELGTIGGMSALEPLRAARRRDLLHWLVYSRAIRQVERRGAWAA